jgi:hypothetical protein
MTREDYTMNRSPLRLVLPAALAVAAALVVAPSAAAAPSCVAQSIQSEHEVYGTPWGHDLVAFLATHPEVLQQFGFQSFGDLAAYSAAQDPTACPPDL